MIINFLRLQRRSPTLVSFSRVCEPGDYMLYAIFFISFSLKALIIIIIVTITTNISITVSIISSPSSKESCSSSFDEQSQLFLPGEKYHIKARLASTRYFSSFILPPISSDRQAGTFSTLVSPTLIIIMMC